MASVKVILKQDNLKKILNRLPKGMVVAGIPASAGTYGTGESVVSVGWKNELGSKESGLPSPITYKGHRGNVTVRSIPERSFMRSTFGENQQKWIQDVADNVQFLLDGTVKPQSFIESLGTVMETAIKQKIIDIHEPPNSQQVVDDKGSDHPLIDTGRMIQSITHEVRND